jgi:hypothetical protein
MEPDRAANLKRDAKICADAWNRSDFPQFVGCLSKRLVMDDAARDLILRECTDSFVAGYGRWDSIQFYLGEIGPPQKFRTLYATTFPVITVIKGGGATITDTSYVLGVSEDDGKTWQFLPLINYNPKLLNKQFPEFEERIAIPKSIPPILGGSRPNQHLSTTEQAKSGDGEASGQR